MNNSSIVFTPAAQKAQAERGSAAHYARRVAEGFPDTVSPELAKFIAEQDTAFLGTASADGAPYIQHRGGPKGFIKVIEDRKSTRLNSSHPSISYAVFCLKKKKNKYVQNMS